MSAAGCPSGLAPAEEAAGVGDVAPFVRASGDARELALKVTGARCAGCIGKIESAVGGVDGVETARLNLTTGRLVARWTGDVVDPNTVVSAVAHAGYRAAPFDPEAAARDDDAYGRLLLRCMGVAGFAAANVMLLSVSVWAAAGSDMGEATRALMHWASAAIVLPAAAYAGRPFFRSAFNALKAGSANMDVPISLAVFLACGLSVFETLRHGPEVYFDAAAMLLFFLLIGRWLDHRLRQRARSAATDLLALQTVAARRLETDDSVTSVSARDLLPGDRFVLHAGERAPVDGVVEAGAGDADLSLVTGETAPVSIRPGSTLHSGCVALTGPITVTATADAETSLVADLARLIESAEQGKSRYRQIADRAAGLYVPVVHSLAFATIAGWLLLGAGPREAIMNAVAVLIITCPCALGLAAPAVQIVASGRLFKTGVLVKTGDALERLASATAVVFDKTGTLTSGKPALLNAGALTAEELNASAALARTSRHPLSRAIVDAAGPGLAAEDVEEASGGGLSGHIGDATVLLGSRAFVGVDGPDAEDDSLETWVRIGGGDAKRLVFADAVRQDARAAVNDLRALGLRVLMLTGDRRAPAARVAAEIGLDEWRSEVSPQEKSGIIEALNAEGERVLMVGDGLNDAPALAGAAVSMTPGSAVDIAQTAADVVYQGDRLAPVARTIRAGRAAKARMLQNFAFAAFYNAVAAPLAMAGHVTPLIAALAMSGSSLVVTLNALRPEGGRLAGPGARQTALQPAE
ncbi:MAG: heavy metal translocating P-type ATPase [Pseudomonadota bacterium]